MQTIINFVNGLPNEVFWLLFSGVVFLIMTIIFYVGPWRKDRGELMVAFFGWLFGMAIFHILGGFSMLKGNFMMMYLATFFALVGSAYVAKFPLSSISNEKIRNGLFYLIMASAIGLTAWLVMNNADPMQSMRAASVYMIAFSGLSGLYIAIQGFLVDNRSAKIKCIGGGSSIWLCCFLTHIMVLTVGMVALAKVFMILTPISLILTIYIAKGMSEKEGIMTPNIPKTV